MRSNHEILLNEEESLKKEMNYELVDINTNFNQNIDEEYQLAYKYEEEFIKKYTNMSLFSDIIIKNIYLNETESSWIHTFIYG